MKLDILFERIKNASKIKKVYWLVLIVYILSLLPLLYISRYNHMTHDDYAFGVFAHQAWQESHSILQAVSAALDYTKWVFEHWQGTYTSVFLMSLQPGIFTEKMYFITTFILLPIFSLGIFMIVSGVNKYLFKGERYSGRIVALFTLMLCIQRVENPVDSFYWFNGSIHYTFFQSLVLIIISLELKMLFDTDRKKKKQAWIAACILSCFTGGANYMSAFSIVLISVSMLVIVSVKNRKINGSMLLVSGIQLITLVINITAPGNQYRADSFSINRNAFTAIMQSFSKCFQDISNWLDLQLIMTIILLVPIILYMLKDVKFHFPFPGLVVAYSICLLAAMRTPTYFAMGNEGPNRASNIVQFMFYLYFILDCCYVIGHVQTKLKTMSSYDFRKIYIKHGEKYIIAMAGVLLFIIASDDYNNYTTLSATASLYYNEAQLYHVECCEREKNLKDDSTDGERVEVKLLHFKPKVLFHKDITEIETDSTNAAIATYYNKSAVVGVQ